MIALACGFFLYASTPALLDPPWVVVAVLWLAWVAALVGCCRWFVRRPVAVFWLALVVVTAWFPIVLGGARYLGWA